MQESTGPCSSAALPSRPLRARLPHLFSSSLPWLESHFRRCSHLAQPHLAPASAAVFSSASSACRPGSAVTSDSTSPTPLRVIVRSLDPPYQHNSHRPLPFSALLHSQSFVMRRVAAITWRRQAGAVAGGAQWRPIQVGPSALRSPPIAAPPSLSRPVCSSSSSSLYPSAFFRPLSTAAKPHLRFSTTATPAMHSTQKLTPASIQSSSPPKPFPPTSPPSRSSPTASPTASSTSPLAGSASPPTPLPLCPPTPARPRRSIRWPPLTPLSSRQRLLWRMIVNRPS